MATILDQTMKDMTVFQQIAYQHDHSVFVHADQLELADKLAWHALEPAVPLFFNGLETPTVITYLQKSAFIANIPYAPIALIGIPWTATGVARDYLAIPHEVGHFVFQHGQFDGKPIAENLQGRVITAFQKLVTPASPYFPDWCYRWLEEVFADVYGCLVAGPIMAQDFQDLQLERTQTEFDKGDDEHPLPLLRPYIYTKALRFFNNSTNNWASWAQVLHTIWNERQKVLYPDGVGTKIKMGVQDLRVKDLIAADSPDLGVSAEGFGPPVDVMVKVILDFLSGINSGEWTTSLGVVPPPDQVGGILYAKNQGWVNDVQGLDAPPPLDVGLASGVEPCPSDALPPEWQTVLWESWIVKEKFFKNSLPPASPAVIEPGHPQDRGVQKDMWIPVLIARDWATEGPNGSWHPPKG